MKRPEKRTAKSGNSKENARRDHGETPVCVIDRKLKALVERLQGLWGIGQTLALTWVTRGAAA